MKIGQMVRQDNMSIKVRFERNFPTSALWDQGKTYENSLWLEMITECSVTTLTTELLTLDSDEFCVVKLLYTPAF